MISFYFDEHMNRDTAKGLSQRSIEVTMAVDVEMEGKDDDTEHLTYATKHNLVLVTFDRAFAGRTMSRSDHAGLICLSENHRRDIGTQVRLLTKFSQDYDAKKAKGRVFWLR